MMIDPRCPEMALPMPRRRDAEVDNRQPVLALGKPRRITPEAVIREHLLGVLPDGVPANFTRIACAEFHGSGRKRTAVAELTMADGLKSTVEVFAWGAGCAGHRWLAWEGKPLSYEGGRWLRVEGDEAC